LNGRYRAIDVADEEGMAALAGSIRGGELQGANITMPYKSAAHRLADAVDLDAARAMSVNTWYVDDGALKGASTDISGLLAVCTRRDIAASGPVTVIGAGGAARAAAVAFADREVRIMARNAVAARALLEACDVSGEVLDWGDATSASLVVNCTPLGMRGEPIPPAILGTASAVIDMAYGPGETPLVAKARASGVPYADGIDVLVAQAADSFAIWTGTTPPLDVMERAARNASSG
jgi:shikimate dehydrogenase